MEAVTVESPKDDNPPRPAVDRPCCAPTGLMCRSRGCEGGLLLGGFSGIAGTQRHGTLSKRLLLRQAEAVERWLAGRSGLTVLEAGCGTGWFCERLTDFSVTGTDLADEVLDRARARAADVTYLAGDIITVEVGGGFDVVLSLEVRSTWPT